MPLFIYSLLIAQSSFQARLYFSFYLSSLPHPVLPSGDFLCWFPKAELVSVFSAVPMPLLELFILFYGETLPAPRGPRRGKISFPLRRRTPPVVSTQAAFSAGLQSGFIFIWYPSVSRRNFPSYLWRRLLNHDKNIFSVSFFRNWNRDLWYPFDFTIQGYAYDTRVSFLSSSIF